MYSANTLYLINEKPFESINKAANYINVSPSTIKNVLDKNIAISKGFNCFSFPITP